MKNSSLIKLSSLYFILVHILVIVTLANCNHFDSSDAEASEEISSENYSSINKSEYDWSSDRINEIAELYELLGNPNEVTYQQLRDLDNEMNFAINKMRIMTERSIINQIENLVEGKLIIQYDSIMNFDESYEYELEIMSINGEKFAQFRTVRLHPEIETLDVVITDIIEISSHVEANLISKDFEIRPVFKEKQIITSEAESTKWKWLLTPSKFDTGFVELSIYTEINSTGGSSFLKVKELKSKIIIDTTVFQKFRQFFFQNWEWIFAIGAPITAFFISLFHSRKLRNNRNKLLATDNDEKLADEIARNEEMNSQNLGEDDAGVP